MFLLLPWPFLSVSFFSLPISNSIISFLRLDMRINFSFIHSWPMASSPPLTMSSKVPHPCPYVSPSCPYPRVSLPFAYEDSYESISHYNLWHIALKGESSQCFGGLGPSSMPKPRARSRGCKSYLSKAQLRARQNIDVGKKVSIDGALRATRTLGGVSS